MLHPTEVEARAGHRIWLRYSDGTAGEVDLSRWVGQGVFAVWNEPGCFERVYIAPHRAIAWSDEVELCPDALYMELTGKSLDELPTEAAVGALKEWLLAPEARTETLTPPRRALRPRSTSGG